MSSVSIDKVREVWARAATFSAHKELAYPEHALVQEFAQQVKARVLEYGCGGGSDTLSYLRRMCDVWYSDVVPINVETTRQRIAAAKMSERAHPIVLDASVPIPLAANTMDVCNVHGVLHHIEEPDPVVAEFFRILKPDGWLYAMLYTETLWQRHATAREALLRAGKCSNEYEAFGWCTDGLGVPYARAYTEAEGRDLLERAGFKVMGARVYQRDEFRTFKAVRP